MVLVPLRRQSYYLALVVVLGALIAACVPKAPEYTLTEQACLDAAEAETTAIRSMAAEHLLAAQIAERESRLVEHERTRSRVMTGRLTDSDMAELVRLEAEAKRAAEAAAAARAAAVAARAAAEAARIAAEDANRAAADSAARAASMPVAAPAPAADTTGAATDGAAESVEPTEPETDVVESEPGPDSSPEDAGTPESQDSGAGAEGADGEAESTSDAESSTSDGEQVAPETQTEEIPDGSGSPE